uniref:DH domain-containing protein n=1 Tax=Monopterus albus TaxID=43700 RepID=A0A3Q3JJU0_MONAL|nr:rho guanine nucleotide exchange factor 1 isoform X1 [Monopterus albus]XP_020445744.1 rho guanine nucleotide exchange factor 1 isoform X1 [Monopterus albus]XP_020445745.1 rho guanine nucleotide exchange factor 1 isoform X1 [Monopterus albus]XP_020445746.1 rho guanine nucleotide exchange factor 1 isoform X1 [Monopterus albus]XP_020445747.1 rho guanine nucleotide exchange factor 1 isoform X1 [Monopterus albus]
MSIIGAEDEDFENDLNDVVDDQSKVFNSVEQLKDRPTHLLVFMQHVFLQFDPAPLLCYLHADLFKTLSAKETKKQFVEFYNTFLDKGATLRVAVPSVVSYELDRTRPDLLSEDLQRRYVQEVQSLQAAEVAKQLEDFRQKRMMGMTPNEAELIDVENHYPTDRVPLEMKEKSVAENLLDKMSETQPTIVSDEEKCQSIFTAVVFYMKHLGVKTRAADSKKSRGGFFRRQLVKNKKDESTKPKPRGVFPGMPSWIAGNTEVKPKMESEAEKDKVNPERKGPPPGRSSVIEPSAPSLPSRREGTTRRDGPPSLPGLEITDGSGNNINAINIPESSHSDGPLSSRLEPPVLSEGGDVSPVGLGGGLTIGEPILPSDISTEDNVEKDRRKTSRKVGRSESARMDRHPSRRRGSSRAKQSRSRSDVDLQPPSTPTTLAPLTPQHSHFAEGPVLDSEGHGHSPTSPSPQVEEMEPRLLEFEQDPPNWRELASPEALSSLSKKETKRQEVINELFATEHAHVRMLSVLQAVFSRPLEREELLSATELSAIFPNLDEIIEMHYNFYENLKKLRLDDKFIVKSISTTVLNRFGGTEGEWFQKLTARFCSHQSWALDQIKNRQKREPRFNAFIQEAESKPQCRRLQLKDIIPIEMQRLTKYPLLLENIAKSTEDLTEKERIQQSAECCRKILNHVNEAVKVMENLLTLREYQRKLDTSGLKPSNELYTEYRNIDLTQKKMLYEGPLTWRVTKEKAIEVQCVLLGELLVLLQRQDDKMVLKCQSKSNIAVQEGKQMLSPIIKLDSVFLREVATDRKAFYVIFTWDSGAQIYELVAQSVGERKIWTDVIKLAVDDLKKSGAPMKLQLPPGGGVPPFSPSTLNAPLSPTENGGLKSSSDRDKDSLMDDKSSDPRHRLIDFLSEKGFDVIGHSNNDQVKVASSALDEVASLKRLLVGSISLSEDSQPDEENGEERTERSMQEMDQSFHSTEESSTTARGEDQENNNTCETDCAAMKGEEDRSISAPLVLSQERMEEVCRRINFLEEQVKRLQTVEEEHHRLQEALSEFSLQGGHFQ